MSETNETPQGDGDHAPDAAVPTAQQSQQEPPASAAPADGAPSQATQTFCTNCGTPVSEGAAACLKCGFNPRSEEHFCSGCGSQTNPGQVICTSCGRAVGNGPRDGVTAAVPMGEKSKVAAGVLAILLGTLGVHKFYLGRTGAGLVMLLVSVLTLGIGTIVMAPIALIEGIIYLTKSDQQFHDDYVVKQKSWF